MVSGFMTNLSVHSMKPRNMVSWFRGFMVSWFHPIHLWDIEKTSGFMVSWFRGFVVSWFHPIHLWDIEKTSGCMVSWFHGFIRSISLTKEDAGFGHLDNSNKLAGGFDWPTTLHICDIAQSHLKMNTRARAVYLLKIG